MSKLRSLIINPRQCMINDSPLINLEKNLNKSHSVIDRILIQPVDYYYNPVSGVLMPNCIRILVFYTEESEEYVPFEFILWEKEHRDSYEDFFGRPNDNSDYLINGCTIYQRGNYEGYFITRVART